MGQGIRYDIIVIGGGHAGVEAAWAGANLGARVALVTIDPTKIGAMSCNPAIGGLAKGQIVREVDALGGLMGLAADATGIQFRMLNLSKGPAVQGPRCQSDKYRYAWEVQRLLACRPQIDVIGGTVTAIEVDGHKIVGVEVAPSAGAVYSGATSGVTSGETSGATSGGPSGGVDESAILGQSPYERLRRHELTGDLKPAVELSEPTRLCAGAVVLTTGTFMRGLLHTGPRQVEGGRIGEAPANAISDSLRALGFELGRLKTGTPPRLDGKTIDFSSLPVQPGDDHPVPFSDMSGLKQEWGGQANAIYQNVAERFPVLAQRPCWITQTSEPVHELIRANLDRAPMYNGQIQTTGPRYCPSIEDKVMRFKDKSSHHVFLEPEALDTDEIYCNGISTSLPADVQDQIVRQLPGCAQARIFRYGYAVEYDMVWPHQIDATGMTKRVAGLFLAGQINGTSGYEEAACQGLLAGLNAVRFTRGQELIRLRRDQAYIGVLMDDLVTKTPREPYRMFTSRAEFRLSLRADNADTRLTPLGRECGLVDDARWTVYQRQHEAVESLREWMRSQRHDGVRLADWAKRPEVTVQRLLEVLEGVRRAAPSPQPSPFQRERELKAVAKLLAEIQYAGYLARQTLDMEKLARQESEPLPVDYDYQQVAGLGAEARHALMKYRPATLGQAGRLAGVTPADLMVLSVAMGR
ncbi:MAG: tRNA uridine-5-carboxymethylaminomethyl(34) synthesis enzyme MnmG [Phycisphaeraceae bacterium]|nr:tRNA uridine-5-carboxymethylaminomethyl(34) synthesis enzyme MnmG [Phycisphaeraceae bacterium]